jgi:tetratricopeptide (TPR) repeat protein
MDGIKKLKCEQCGCESEIVEAFRKHKARFYGKTEMLCPDCWSQNYMQMSKLNLYLMGLALFGGFIVHYFDQSNSLVVMLINIPLIYIFMALSVIPHEMGHIIVGRLVGYEVFRVIIGYGNVLFNCRLFGYDWELRPFPLGGVTVIATHSPQLYRLRRFVMLLAGPLVNLILILLLVGTLPSLHLQGVPLGVDIIIANGILLVLNLWPHRITTAAGVIENDGLALMITPFMKRNKIDEHLVAYCFISANEFSRQKQFEKTITLCEQGLQIFPDALLLRIQLGVALLALNEHEKARDTFTSLLAREDTTSIQKAIILNNIAYTNILAGRTDLIEESDSYSYTSYKNAPWVPAIKGTRGAVLVETGRIDEGLQLLREAFDASPEPQSKALNAAHIALGEKLRGNTEESRKFLDITYSLDPQCQLLNRFQC